MPNWRNAEPLTPAARPSADYERGWALCDAYWTLRAQMERYIRGEISGQSFLLAGHRGSGKTTLVHLAVQQLRWLAEGEVEEVRDLEISISGKWGCGGPNRTLKLEGTARYGDGDRSPFSVVIHKRGQHAELIAKGLLGLLGTRELSGKTTIHAQGCAHFKIKDQVKEGSQKIGGCLGWNGGYPPVKVDASVDWSGQREVTVDLPAPLFGVDEVRIDGTLRVESQRRYAAIPFLVPLHGPDLLMKQGISIHDEEKLAQHAMAQIMRTLHHALCDEIGTRFRDAVASNGALDQELAGQLRVELDDAADLRTLRNFWDRGGFLPDGVLGAFRQKGLRLVRAASVEGIGQGFRELLAIDTTIRGARMVIEPKANEPVAINLMGGPSSARIPAVGVEHAVRLASPILSLLAGGYVAAAAVDPLGPIMAGAVGLSTLLLTHAFLRRTGPPPNESILMGETSVAALDLLLPAVVDRAFAAGLAPVFVVDELDKVDDLDRRLDAVMRRLKHFVTDRAFFTLLADRSYYERLRAPAGRHAYLNDETRLLISYAPEQLDAYLRIALPKGAEVGERGASSGEPEGTADKRTSVRELVRHLILFRSKAHLSDVRREIREITRNDQLRLKERGKWFWQIPANRLAIYFEIAIEAVFEHEDVQRRVRQDPDFVQWLNDALFEVARRWQDQGNNNTLTFTREALEELAKKRLGSSQRDGCTRCQLTDRDYEDLFKAVKELVGLLSRPWDLLARVCRRIEGGEFNSLWDWPAALIVAQGVPLTVPSDQTTGGGPTEEAGKDIKVKWTFDQFGNPLVDSVPWSLGLEAWCRHVAADENWELLSLPFRTIIRAPERTAKRLARVLAVLEARTEANVTDDVGAFEGALTALTGTRSKTNERDEAFEECAQHLIDERGLTLKALTHITQRWSEVFWYLLVTLCADESRWTSAAEVLESGLRNDRPVGPSIEEQSIRLLREMKYPGLEGPEAGGTINELKRHAKSFGSEAASFLERINRGRADDPLPNESAATGGLRGPPA